MADFCARISAAIDALRDCAGTVLVVTHGGAIRAALKVALGLSSDRIVAVEPCSLSALDMSASPRLLAYNVTHFSVESQTTD
jgi:glucosyl-3-phosphoglycerate phosphatase